MKTFRLNKAFQGVFLNDSRIEGFLKRFKTLKTFKTD